jgi:hypothetical protein
LRDLYRWVMWRYTWADDREEWAKVPLNQAEDAASSTNPKTWQRFSIIDLFFNNRKKGKFDGPGIVLGPDETAGLHLGGVDLDDVVGPDGTLAPLAQEVLAALNGIAYAEYSPSGTGIKLFLYGQVAPAWKKRSKIQPGGGHVEFYSASRYFTVTGRVLGTPPATWPDATEALRALQRQFCEPQTEPAATPVARNLSNRSMSDDQLWTKMFNSKNGEAIRRLWEGDTSGYVGDSEADMALASHLMWWTNNDAARADAMFRTSGLFRPKWDRKCKGEIKYGQWTLQKAAATDGGYDPSRGRGTATVGDPVSEQTVETPTVEQTTPTVEMPAEPEPPDPSIPTDPGPFPESLLRVPGFVGEVMAYTLATAFRRSPQLALAGALALLGTLTGRKVRDGLNTRTNVYILGVAPSGGGKDRPRVVNKEILAAAQATARLGGESLASASGLVTAVADNLAVLFQLDELGRILKTLNDPRSPAHLYGIITKLMHLYSSAGNLYKGDSYADSSYNKEINQPHACLLGTTVPQSLYAGLTKESVTDGFLSRMLIFEDHAMPPKQRPDVAALPTSIIDTARWWANYSPGGNLGWENPTPRVIDITVGAQGILDTFDSETEEHRVVLGDPYGALWTRAMEKAGKLALLFACSRAAENSIIDEPAAEWACALSCYLTRRMAFLAHRQVADGEYDAKRQRVFQVIQEAGSNGIDQSQLTRRTQWIRKRERDEILDALLEAEDIGQSSVATGGRLRRVFISRR